MMRSGTRTTAIVLAFGVLALGGCKKDKAPAKATEAVEVDDGGDNSVHADPRGAPGPKAKKGATSPSRFAQERDPWNNQFQVPTAAPKAEAKIEVGMTRDALVDALGNCANRAYYLPQSKTRQTVEIFQPGTPECVKQFGDRNYQVTQGILRTIAEGRLESTKPPERKTDA